MAAQTFSQLYNDALQQADELTGSGSATAKAIIKAGINELYSEVAGLRDFKTLENSATVTTVSGTQEYTPVDSSTGSTARIRRIQSVVDQTNNRILTEVNREVFEQKYPYVASTDTGDVLYWYVSGYDSNRDIKIKVYKVPNATTTLNVIYYEEPTILAADSDIPLIPDQYHYGLTYGGLAKYYEFQKDPTASYYRRLAEEYKAKILQAEYNETDEMPAMRPQGINKGIITGKIGRIYN